MRPASRRSPLPPPRAAFTLEEPGQPLPFDADRGLVEEVTARYSVKALVASLPKDEAAARKTCAEFGRGAMALTLELADGKYQDRAGEMIEKVYRKTGVSFPHRFQRYAELFLIAVRPLDRWNVTCATPDKLVLEVSGCAVFQALKERGLIVTAYPSTGSPTPQGRGIMSESARRTGRAEATPAHGELVEPRAENPQIAEGLPCLELCLGGFRVAGEKTGDVLRMDVPKTLPRDGRCQFVFTTRE